jgi:hypothetical protein
MKTIVNTRNMAVWMRQLAAVFFILAGLLGMIASANPPSGKGNPGSGGGQGKGKMIFSNTILMKLTAQARANLKVVGEDVNPSATGLASLDVIC